MLKLVRRAKERFVINGQIDHILSRAGATDRCFIKLGCRSRKTVEENEQSIEANLYEP